MNPNALITIANFIRFAIFIYIGFIFIRILLSWFNPNPNTAIMRALSKTVDPALFWFKKRLPLQIAFFDFSPVILILLLTIISDVSYNSIIHIANGGNPLAIIVFLLFSILNIINIFLFWILILLALRLLLTAVQVSPYSKIVIAVIILTEPLINLFNPYIKKLPQIGRIIVCFLIFLLLKYILQYQVMLALLKWKVTLN